MIMISNSTETNTGTDYRHHFFCHHHHHDDHDLDHDHYTTTFMSTNGPRNLRSTPENKDSQVFKDFRAFEDLKQRAEEDAALHRMHEILHESTL